MKKSTLSMLALSSVAAIGSVTLANPSKAFAGIPYYFTNIEVLGKTISSPKHIIANDGGVQTSFLPLFYVNQALSQYGITGSWDGNEWSIVLPPDLTANMDSPQSGQQTSSNVLSMAINGQVVQYAPRQTAGDPANGYQNTTYLPIWYISQVLGRIGFDTAWDGKNWTITKTTPETQQDMSNAMWTLFGKTSLDIDHHATMQEAGVLLTTGPTTAQEVATWLSQWAAKSKGINYGFAYHPYSLKYEMSTDPFVWAQDNDLYQGTSIESGADVVSTTDAQTIISNLEWWLNGSKVVNGKHVLHAPFFTNYASWNDATVNHNSTQEQWQQWLKQNTYWYDRVQVWGSTNNANLYISLPAINNSSSQYIEQFGITSSGFEYGFMKDMNTSSSFGGTTVTVPMSNSSGFTIEDQARVGLTYDGWELSVAYKKVNGQIDFSNPEDIGAIQ